MVSLPVVLRARGFRLYTPGGRLTDLWQAGGRAVLGHNPAGILRDLKNCAARGLFAPLPHPQERRLAKALSRLLPGRIFRFYTDRLSLRSALEAAGFSGEDPFPDPAFGTLPDGAFPGGALSGEGPVYRGPVLWRPFLEEVPSPTPPAPGAYPLLVPLLPWPLAPWVLAPAAALEDRFPPADPLPPVLLAAATRSVYDTIAAGTGGGRPVYPRLNRALYSPGEGSPWRRRGIYLSYRALQNPAGTRRPIPGPPAAPPACPGWEDLFRRFLEAGFLIPPDPADPLILPGILSPGEEVKLAALLQSVPSTGLAF
jgi:hypothetical protein